MTSTGRHRFRSRPPGRSRKPRRSDTRIIKYVLLLVVPPDHPHAGLHPIVTSFKGIAETDPSHAWSLPHTWSLDGWRDAWTSLSPALGNSFKLAIPATLISIVLGSLNGFVLSKWRFPGADFVFTFFLFGLFIPYQAVMIPLTQIFKDVQFPDGIPRPRLRARRLRHPDHDPDLPQLLRDDPERVDGGGADGPRRDAEDVLVGRAAGLGAGFVVAAIWQFTLDLERLPLRRVHHHRPVQVAGHGRAEQRGRLARDAVQHQMAGRCSRRCRRWSSTSCSGATSCAGSGGISEGLMAGDQARQAEQALPERLRGREGALARDRRGEFLVLVGPSGCGKTTRAADDRRARGHHRRRPSASAAASSTTSLRADRDIAMVFQNYALYPHMTVPRTSRFGLEAARRCRRPRSSERVARGGASCSASRSCSTASPRSSRGGQRQRVAMGRAIVREPQVFLMDEPLSNLDAKLRVQMRAEIAALQQRARRHHRLRHPRPGRGDDDGRPRRRAARRACSSRSTRRRTLYDRPANLFVAGFIGSPAMNLSRGTHRARDEPVARRGDRSLPGGAVGATRPWRLARP